MKGKEIIAHAVRTEMPDMEQLRENIIRKTTEKGTAKHNALAKRLVPVTACLAVVLAMVIAFPHFVNNDITTPETDLSGTYHPLGELLLRGLPVENFSLANVEDDAAMMDRLVFMDFGAMLEWGADCFAVVKVYDVKSEKSTKSPFNVQISNAAVLQGVYGCEDFEEPGHIKIRQSIIENHFCLGTTNLLRKGGVYLLPLKQSDDKWYSITGDMDVLFEIDDKGKVWSHSDFEDFKRYDGKSIDFFIEHLKNMFSDKEFMLANSPFAGMLRGWTLADITITCAEKSGTDRYGQPCFSYEFAVNEILFEPNHKNSAPLVKTGILTVRIDEADPITLTDKNRYLICLDRYEGEIHTNSRMIAKIGSDDAITVIPSSGDSTYLGESVFTPYNGYKISDIRGMVLRIAAWREAQK